MSCHTVPSFCLVLLSPHTVMSCLFVFLPWSMIWDTCPVLISGPIVLSNCPILKSYPFILSYSAVLLSWNISVLLSYSSVLSCALLIFTTVLLSHPSYFPILLFLHTPPLYIYLIPSHPITPFYSHILLFHCTVLSFTHSSSLPNFPSYCSVLSGHSEWILRVVIMMALSMVRFKRVNQMVNFVGQF